MRLYGKKLLRKSMSNAVSLRQETRDGILWDVLPAQRLCRVKIQGSNEQIVAYYPQNWETAPTWLKKGTSIRIIHVGGDRGKIEVFGIGRAVPTPVSGDQLPVMDTGVDGLVNGCYVTACAIKRMAVLIYTGSFRISDVVYYLTAIPMADGDDYHIGDGGPIGQIAGVVEVNAAPATGLFRYDLISVGADSVLDYTAGTPAAEPTKPSVGAAHVALAYILVRGGATEITDADVNHDWTTPAIHIMTITVADDEMAWADPVFTTVTLQVFDQYGVPLDDTHVFTLAFVSGNGTLFSSQSGTSGTSVQQTVYGTSSYAFTYTRDHLDPGDVSPMFKGTVVSGDFSLDLYAIIKLLDAIGGIMT